MSDKPLQNKETPVFQRLEGAALALPKAAGAAGEWENVQKGVRVEAFGVHCLEPGHKMEIPADISVVVKSPGKRASVGAILVLIASEFPARLDQVIS